ncbi:MAG TPA: MobF family relaxase [Acidimicrobiia bacterium]|nr:MobF family relaxase [Acidimicrobiia bacterium]
MLSLAKAAKDYYLRKLGEISPREDYYLRGGTASGHWRGKGAAELGLEGSVSAEGLVRLFDGEHPGTGAQLGRQLRIDGVGAWDVTFSADKSVSLLWALGDQDTRRQVMGAFEAATSQAFGYLQSVASSTRGASKTLIVDDNGDRVCDENGRMKHRVETWPIATSGYVAAAFTEYTSRADDPQLHTHMVIANKVKGVDGRWRTIDGRLLYRHQLDAGYLHEAVLRRELTERLGVEWQPVRNGMADIVGFTRVQIEAFSRRRGQLEAWRQEQGLADTPAARQKAVLATRSPKQDHPLVELEVEWRERASEVGLTTERIARIVGRDREVSRPDPVRLAEQLVSPEGLTARTSSFGRAEVIKEIAASLPDGGTRTEIEDLADGFLQVGDVVPLLPGSELRPIEAGEDHERYVVAAAKPAMPPMRRRDGRPFPSMHDRLFTTVELLATEQRIIEQAVAGVGAGRWTAPDRLVRARLRRHRGLTDGQRMMVRRFATSGSTVDVGVGPAGSGKTAVMAVISQLAALTGTPIQGAALAARAAAGLQAATGIPSTTLARLIGEASEEGLPEGVIVVVDEAGMVGTRQLAAVSDLVEKAEGKLILTGDDRQLPEIDAGGLFGALTRILPAVELTDNIRQDQPWERVALTELRTGSVAQALDTYERHRRLSFGKDRPETVSRAVQDWFGHVTDTGDLTSGLLMAYDNDTVAELNERARARLAAARRLHGPTLEAGERTFQAGDRILCRKNQSRLGVLNGDLGTITGVFPEQNSLNVRLDRDPETRELPDWYLDHGHVAYGYALTGHKAQGVTTGRTFTVLTGHADREWVYVAMSRGREANTLYLATPEPADKQCAHLNHPKREDELDDVATRLGRSTAQTAAIDHLTQERLNRADIVRSPPPSPSSGDLERLAWWMAQRSARRAELEQRERGLDLAVGR